MILKDLFITIVTLLAQLLLVALWIPHKLFTLLDGAVYGKEEEEPAKKPKKVKVEKQKSVFDDEKMDFEI